MNAQRLLELADDLEKMEHYAHSESSFDFYDEPANDIMMFNLTSLVDFRDCGTVACIAGHAVLKWRPGWHYGPIMGPAAEILELDEWTAKHLFTPNNTPNGYEAIDSQQAARTLRHLAATGEVRWDV